MTMTDEKAAAGGAGRRAVEELVASGGLDGLFEQIDAGQISLTGADGLLPALLKVECVVFLGLGEFFFP